MTATAERIADYEMIHGKEEVERFLDAVLAIQEHVDPHRCTSVNNLQKMQNQYGEEIVRKTPYDDLWGLDDKEPKQKKTKPKNGNSLWNRKKTFYYLF